MNKREIYFLINLFITGYEKENSNNLRSKLEKKNTIGNLRIFKNKKI